MAEANQPPMLRRIAHEEFIGFLVKKKVTGTCPACGDARNVINSAEDGSVGLYLMTGIEVGDLTHNPFELGAGMIYVSTECVNCGHFRNFSANTVLEFLDGPVRTAER